MTMTKQLPLSPGNRPLRWKTVALAAVATFVASCAPSPTNRVGSDAADVERASQATAIVSQAPGSYQRPYGPRAPWNVQVHGLERHPETDYYTSLLWRSSDRTPGNFNLSFDSYTYPVYFASQATGWYPVRTEWGNAPINGRRVPWNPDWRGAPGTDGQAIILDPNTGREWNLFQVGFRNGVVRATNGSLVPGNYMTRETGYRPSRGVGIPYLAMLVRPESIRAGVIDHALSMPIRNPSGQYYVAPATKLEHRRSGRGVPEGMRFAIDITEAEIQSWAQRLPAGQTRRSGIIIARALRDYGWFITDTSGAAHFQFEANITAQSEWAALGLSQRSVGNRTYPRDLLDGLIQRDRVYAVVPSDEYPSHLQARR